MLAPFAVDQAADLCPCGHKNAGSAAALVFMSWTVTGMRTTATKNTPRGAGAGAPTPPPTPALRATLRERRGRPEPGQPSRVELLAEAFALALPPIPVTLRVRQLLAQTSDLFLLPLEQIVAFGPGRLCALIGHTRFMAASRQKYKCKLSIWRNHPLNEDVYSTSLAWSHHAPTPDRCIRLRRVSSTGRSVPDAGRPRAPRLVDDRRP